MDTHMTDTHITIRKLNNAFLKLECDTDIALELSEAFSYQMPGYKFSPAFRMGKWDGFIRMFNMGSRKIGVGLYKKVLEFCISHEYTYSEVTEPGYDAPSYVNPELSFESIRTYIDSLDVYARGEKLIVRDYQINGVLIGLRERNGILNLVTGAGKSFVVMCIARYITEVLGGRFLIIVPTVGLVSQLKNDFKDYSTHNGYDVESNVHQISAGVDKKTDKPIVISTFQSLKGISPDWLNSFTGIITDEGHKVVAASFKSIYDSATEVTFRLACTGTVHDTKCHIMSMMSLTGPVYEIANARDLISANQLVPLKIKAISLNYPLDICKLMKKVEYEDEINWITSNTKRNIFIKNIAVATKGTTLVFFRFVEHGRVLHKLIQDHLDSRGIMRDVHFVDGSVDKDEREDIRLSANSTDSIIVCSLGTYSTGVNLPSVENMIPAHPTKSKISFLQSIGRGLRLAPGKTHCNLIDIGDCLTYKSKVNTTYKHFGERLKMLTAEGHAFDIVNVNF
jgi:superfamily II DNA or RNA helicase